MPTQHRTRNDSRPNLICFSHLRWHFVYQRPQHLLSRFASVFNVFFVEEVTFDAEEDHYSLSVTKEDVIVYTPHLRVESHQERVRERLMLLLDSFFRGERVSQDVFWYYTPMALRLSRQFDPKLVIYDCMDELSLFKHASQELKTLENELFQRADVVFTGGKSLYEAKRFQHTNVHLFASSIDRDHFVRARNSANDPEGHAEIPRPRIGYYGVIDERIDLALIEAIAVQRPEWQLVLIGPVVKIEQSSLPKAPNIHYLGARDYMELPDFLGHWDVAMIPFALNEATRFISPTKTPEYLSGGVSVVSTPIRDVVAPYEDEGLVRIASNADQFVELVDAALTNVNRAEWLARVDAFLADRSWDSTWQSMMSIIQSTLQAKAVLFSMDYQNGKEYV